MKSGCEWLILFLDEIGYRLRRAQAATSHHEGHEAEGTDLPKNSEIRSTKIKILRGFHVTTLVGVEVSRRLSVMRDLCAFEKQKDDAEKAKSKRKRATRSEA